MTARSPSRSDPITDESTTPPPNDAGVPVPDAEASAGGTDEGGHEEPRGRYLWLLCLTALGVVFGDIGTSPIYAFREAFHESHGLAPTENNVMGVLSLIFWSLVIVISVKYLLFVMRADNHGEGGIMALTALVTPPAERSASRRRAILVLAGLFGAALLYGDSMITPAISVLSAVEGLEVATPLFRPYVIPITLGILLALFSFQKRGTSKVGLFFGPITLIWFAALAVLGVASLWRDPHVLLAVSPTFAHHFFLENEVRGFLVLGSVFLVVTGGEALYADMGHFGPKPIRLTWFGLVLPALMLNYFGQGAFILANPGDIKQPFFHMAPEWALYPLVVLATMATVIASQAVISGAFSLTRQAIQLGYLPRMAVEHTSSQEEGQIYIPAINWALMIACVGLVVGFGSSSALAAAYGVAVTTDMAFTTILFSVVARRRWKWHVLGVFTFAILLLVVDLAFWGSNLPKVPHGGWFPLVVAGAVFVTMTTWKAGRGLLSERLQTGSLPLDQVVKDIVKSRPHRTPGTAVFMHKDPEATPPALLHNLKHNRVLHERVVFMSILTTEAPYVANRERIQITNIAKDFYHVTVRYGFAESPDIPDVLRRCGRQGLRFEMMKTTFFLSRETLVLSDRPGMMRWRKRLFHRLSVNSLRATAYFGLPPNRVVEMGMQLEL